MGTTALRLIINNFYVPRFYVFYRFHWRPVPIFFQDRTRVDFILFSASKASLNIFQSAKQLKVKRINF